ncbi:MAG TPA: hypothetical protein VI702_04845 [Nitrospiria bacterium]
MSGLSRRAKKILAVVIVAAAAAAIAAFISSQKFNLHLKTNRTHEAEQRIQAIHAALAQWHEDPNMAKGTISSDINQVGRDGRTFREHFRSEADWLTSGDAYYRYGFTHSRLEDGRIVPMVTASARDPRKVKEAMIITQPDGKAAAIKLPE